MNTSQSIMNDPRRATDSEWYCLEARTSGSKSDVVAYSCILELRDRIKALEATQHGHVDLLHLSDAEREQIRKQLASPGRFEVLEAAAQPPKPNHPAKPDSSLKERIKSRNIECACSTWEEAASSVLDEVAFWLDTMQEFDAAILLRQEAEQ